MTTPTSPDGQTQSTTQTTSDPTGDDAPIRNWGDVKKLLAEVVPGREEIKELRSFVEGIGGKLDALAKPPASAEAPAAPAPTGLEAQIQALANVVNGIVAKDDGKAKADRRRAITEAVVSQASEQHRDLIRGQLASLALDGEIDLHAEQTQAEVDKAAAKLRARYPAAFATAGNMSPADSVRHGVVPDGTPLHEYTREQLDRLTDEDFAKIRRQGAKSKLAV